MIELRADGSIPGPHKVARIYKVSSDGTIGYNVISGEFESDIERHYKRIEGYSTFRGWMTQVIPNDRWSDMVDGFKKIPLPPEEILQAKLEQLKSKAETASAEFKRTAQAYVNTLPEGDVRNVAQIAFNEAFAAMKAAFK